MCTRGGRGQKQRLGLSCVLEVEAGKAAVQGAHVLDCTSTARDAASLVEETPLSFLAASLPLLQVGMQPPSFFPIPGVYEYSFLSGKLNILNKHCLKSIIYGQGFRRGDQSFLGAEGVSICSSPHYSVPSRLVQHKGLGLGMAALSSTQRIPSSGWRKTGLSSLAGRNSPKPSTSGTALLPARLEAAGWAPHLSQSWPTWHSSWKGC